MSLLLRTAKDMEKVEVVSAFFAFFAVQGCLQTLLLLRLVAISSVAISRGEEDRGRQSKLGIQKPAGPDWMSLGAPEEWANITMWLLYCSFARA